MWESVGHASYSVKDIARSMTEESRKHNRDRLSQKAKAHDISPGDSVIIKSEERLTLTAKWNPRWTVTIDINRTPVSKTRPLSSYQLTHDKVMQAWTSDIHAAARQEPTGGPVFILYSTQSSSYIYRYTVLIRDYYYIAIYT